MNNNFKIWVNSIITQRLQRPIPRSKSMAWRGFFKEASAASQHHFAMFKSLKTFSPIMWLNYSN
jgi:hypothetical protein